MFIRCSLLNSVSQFKSSLRWVSRFKRGVKNIDVNFSNGGHLRIECDKFGLFADGSAVGSVGDTSVSVTVVSKKNSSLTSFLPLTVNYQQKAASFARIPTNFLRRELAASEKEILTARLIDRSLRPLFPAGYTYDTQIVCKLISSDKINSAEITAINAASAALHLSDIPWDGPIGSVRVAIKNNLIYINPDWRQLEESTFQIIVTSNKNQNIVMLEGFANKVTSLKNVSEAIKVAIDENRKIIEAIEKARETNPIPKRHIESPFSPNEEFLNATRILSENRLIDIFTNYEHDKTSRDADIKELQAQTSEKLIESFPNMEGNLFLVAFAEVVKATFRKVIRETGKRIDGRSLTDLRDIECEIGLYKPLHGSSLFRRGQTRVMCSLTLDSLETSLKVDPITALSGGPRDKNFFLHYEFPSYAVGETGSVGSYGRREVGHGALAEKSLRAAIPEDFPFALRLDCEVLESNGSSSMGSVCAGSLALMDGGVPVAHPTAGVALGLVYDPLIDKDQFTLLTDITGFEDFFGDMDFKMAGNGSGLTALQLDVKIASGLPLDVVDRAFEQGCDGKEKILKIMGSKIKVPKAESRDNWPISEVIDIPPHRKSRLFGYGRETLKRLNTHLGIRLTPDEQDTNKFILYAPDKESFKEAKETVNELVTIDDYEKKLEFKAIYSARVVDIIDSGVKVTLYPGMDPVFLPNRELDQRPIKHPSAIGIKVGSEIMVKYFGRDPASGQMRLSRRVVQALDPLRKNFHGE